MDIGSLLWIVFTVAVIGYLLNGLGDALTPGNSDEGFIWRILAILAAVGGTAWLGLMLYVFFQRQGG